MFLPQTSTFYSTPPDTRGSHSPHCLRALVGQTQDSVPLHLGRDHDLPHGIRDQHIERPKWCQVSGNVLLRRGLIRTLSRNGGMVCVAVITLLTKC